MVTVKPKGSPVVILFKIDRGLQLQEALTDCPGHFALLLLKYGRGWGTRKTSCILYILHDKLVSSCLPQHINLSSKDRRPKHQIADVN